MTVPGLEKGTKGISVPNPRGGWIPALTGELPAFCALPLPSYLPGPLRPARLEARCGRVQLIKFTQSTSWDTEQGKEGEQDK